MGIFPTNELSEGTVCIGVTVRGNCLGEFSNLPITACSAIIVGALVGIVGREGTRKSKRGTAYVH